MILVDSSVWIEEVRRTGSSAHRALIQLLDSRAQIAITEPVIMELLAGSRSHRELSETRTRLLTFPMLRVGGLATYEHAAAVWRECRAAGEQLRNKVDCLIAAVAIREDASVLHQDRDFDVIARHTPLQIEPVHR
jgi:predicted nucleic acid-binding protein